MFYVKFAFGFVFLMQYVFDAFYTPELYSLNQTIALVVVLIVGAVIIFGKKQLGGH